MPDVFYKPQGREVELFLAAHKLKMSVLLKGPTGCGKTRFVESVAQKLGLNLITVSCHEETSATDLVGRHLLMGSETVFVDGPLTRAVRQGGILYLDEVAEARPDVLVVLHSITDYRRQLFIERTGETLVAPDSFMVTASFNPGYQKGLKELKPSTRQRFVSIPFSYPLPGPEAEIVAHESGLDLKMVKHLIQIATQIRNLKELGLMETVSTRLLIDAAKLIGEGIEPRLACRTAIVEPLTDEDEDRVALTDLISMQF